RCPCVNLYEKAVSQLPVAAESPYGLSADDRSVDDLLFAVRPISCLAIARDSGGDVPRIAGKPRGIPCIVSQTEPSSTPNQSIWRHNDGQLCSDYSRLRRRRLVRGAGRTTGSVMSWTR